MKRYHALSDSLRVPAQRLMLMQPPQLPQPPLPGLTRPCLGTKLQWKDGGAEGTRYRSELPSADAFRPPPAAAKEK